MDKALRIILALAIFFPFAFLFMLSVGRQWGFPAILPSEWTWSNWLETVVQGGELSYSLGLSLFISLIVAILATGLGFWTSKSLNEHPWGRRLLQLAYLPYIFAPVILAACLQVYFLTISLSGRAAGVLLAQLFIAYPFAVIFFGSFWNESLRASGQLAATLGATLWQTFVKVFLPIARGPLLVCFFQTFLISWFEYGLTMLIGVGKVQTLTVKVFQFVNEANIFYAALAGCLLAVPPVLILWLNKRYIFVQR